MYKAAKTAVLAIEFRFESHVPQEDFQQIQNCNSLLFESVFVERFRKQMCFSVSAAA